MALRPLWHAPQDIPYGPQRMPGLAVRAGSPPPAVLPVREVNRYPFLSTLTFILPNTDPVLAVSQPDTTRIWLSFRNQTGSAGTVFIGFGNGAGNNNSTFQILPGGQLLLDIVIPQDDVWLSTDITATCIVSYGNVAP